MLDHNQETIGPHSSRATPNDARRSRPTSHPAESGSANPRRGRHSETRFARERRLWVEAWRRTFERGRAADRRPSVVLIAFVVTTITLASADYTVRKGDTLSRIASSNGTTVSAIVDANGLTNPNLIRVGQTLVIPGQGGESAPTSGTYVVVGGDTLARIASAHGTTVSAIVTANNIANPNVIRIGQQLLVGSAVSTPQTAPAAPAQAPKTHVVAKGETLGSIAGTYGTTVAAIQAANGLTTTTIYVGTTLIVEGAAAPTVTGTPQTGIHLVAAGETLGAIAAKYGVSVSSLVDLNGLVDANRIRIGQELKVPGAGAAWVCPVAGARYFNDWGFPRSGGRFHQGNDLFAARGTPVLAPVSGVVEFKTGSIGGLQFWLAGADGVRYIGSHLDGFGIAGNVAAGDVIGYVGDSGNALGSSPHVHFEMARDGQTFNPYPTLQANGC